MISCIYSSKEELKKIIESIPLNQNVRVTLGRWGFTRELPIGRLHNFKMQGEWGASFYWTDGKYMEYVWLQPKFDDHISSPILSIEVLS